jgi:D-amino peptidase
MKILIAADMEGITGVVSADQTNPGHAEYGRFRRLMTGDVNAAIRGAFDGGADEVVVSDGHWSNLNVLIEELDPRARLNSGSPRPFSMVEGVQHGVDGVLFVGYHARVGSLDAILDHTWSSGRVDGVWLNGEIVGEIGLNAAVCGHFGAPVLMISGDQTACAEATGLLGDVETAVVKRATGRWSAECLPPEATARLIQDAAVRGVRQLGSGAAPAPRRLAPPITVAVEFIRAEMADGAAILPGAERIGGKRVSYTAADMPTAYRAFRSLVGLA